MILRLSSLWYTPNRNERRFRSLNASGILANCSLCSMIWRSTSPHSQRFPYSLPSSSRQYTQPLPLHKGQFFTEQVLEPGKSLPGADEIAITVRSSLPACIRAIISCNGSTFDSSLFPLLPSPHRCLPVLHVVFTDHPAFGLVVINKLPGVNAIVPFLTV